MVTSQATNMFVDAAPYCTTKAIPTTISAGFLKKDLQGQNRSLHPQYYLLAFSLRFVTELHSPILISLITAKREINSFSDDDNFSCLQHAIAVKGAKFASAVTCSSLMRPKNWSPVTLAAEQWPCLGGTTGNQPFTTKLVHD